MLSGRRLVALAAVLAVAAGVSALAATGVHAARGGSVTITFWHAYSSDSPEVKTIDNVLIPRFERQNPNIKVQAVAIPYDSLHQKLLTATAGGTLPDVVRSDIIWVPELANLGVLASLDTQMKDFSSLAKVTYPGALQTNKWKGHYYGLPLDTNTRVLMYNSAALAEAGMTTPPKTWGQLEVLANKLKGKDAVAFADGGTSGWSILPWIWSGGGSLTNRTYTKATGYLNSPKTIAAVQFWVNLHKQGEAKFLNVDGGANTSDALAQAKAATILDGPWMFPIFQGQYPSFHLQTGLVPAGPGGKSISVVGGEDIVMTQSSKHKAETEQFIRFMLSPWAQTQMAKVGQMSVRKDLKAQLTKIHSYYGIFIDQLATARPRTPSPAWPKMDTIIDTYVAKAIKGDLSVKEALTEAAKQIDGLLASS
ncbi:MAG TPA: extracellular solute-binding protein [Gaiellaceae bacterium]|jgi:multiple sugar transport system substrate-binding protein